jgi:4-alpha-glucanotransferase
MLRAIVSLPGIPCVYYGDECGVQGTADPYNRGTFPWGHEDMELQEQVRALLSLRKKPVLQTGSLSIRADGPDAFVIRRTISCGHDVFGDPAEDDVYEVRIQRP